MSKAEEQMGHAMRNGCDHRNTDVPHRMYRIRAFYLTSQVTPFSQSSHIAVLNKIYVKSRSAHDSFQSSIYRKRFPHITFLMERRHFWNYKSKESILERLLILP
jgi:hypothetical protein